MPYVRGHTRRLKSGKETTVRPHYRSMPTLKKSGGGLLGVIIIVVLLATVVNALL